MVKLTDEEAEVLLMVLAFVRMEVPTVWMQAQETEPRYGAYRFVRDNGGEGATLFPPPDHISEIPANTVMASMTKQLSYEGENTEGTLIDIMAEVLQNPQASNALAGRNLEQLRKAILTPEERMTLKQRLATSRACVSCGVEMRPRDVGTITESGLACAKCVEPQWVHCGSRGCDNRVEVPASGRKFFSKQHWCEEHRGDGEQRPIEVEGHQGRIYASGVGYDTVVSPEQGTIGGINRSTVAPGWAARSQDVTMSRLEAAARRLRPSDFPNGPAPSTRTPR